jgi:hypothetical protein
MGVIHSGGSESFQAAWGAAAIFKIPWPCAAAIDLSAAAAPVQRPIPREHCEFADPAGQPCCQLGLGRTALPGPTSP